MQLTTVQKKITRDFDQFTSFIWHFYQSYGRQFAWRNSDNPYYIFISEIMLQQTQTDRVIPKFDQFTAAFADFKTLADAELRDVLGVWQGLGYNRRGKALWDNAKRIVAQYNGQMPHEPEILETFSHIGPNTARSIVAFAFNKPVVFIETNIRTVFLHTFFSGKEQVSDIQLMPLIEKTLDQQNPREWYYALMDYGVHLKKMLPNPSRKSAHHTVQSKFEGSDRQIRGRILKKLVSVGSIDKQKLFSYLGQDHDRYERILHDLIKERMAKQNGSQIMI